MLNFRGLLMCSTVVCLSFASNAVAQTVPQAPPQPQEATKSAVPPGAAYLAKTYGISIDEATRRINMQPEIAALSAKLKTSNDAGFAGIWVQQEPTFKVVIAYTDPNPAKLSALNLSSDLSSVVELRALDKARSVILAAQDRVIAALNTAGVRDYVSYVEVETGKLVVKVPNISVLALVKPVLGTLGIDVATEVGPIPQPVAAPRGVQPGDYIYGGYYFWQTNQIPAGTTGSALDRYKSCSLSFAVKLGSTQGILTAGHCNPGPDGTGYWNAINGHWVEMPAPTIARWKYGTKYDYQFHETTGFTTGNFVYYENRGTEPSYPSSGYFTVNGTVGYYGQTKGMTVCKSGWKTGLVCGTIDNGAYTYSGAKGWIHVARSYGTPLAQPGDSGGAVFSPADANGNIKAYGSVTAGQTLGGGASEMVYMPIDYIDDEANIQVITN